MLFSIAARYGKERGLTANFGSRTCYKKKTPKHVGHVSKTNKTTIHFTRYGVFSSIASGVL